MESTISPKTIPPLLSKTKELVILIICLTCVFLFVYVAYSKITDHQRFLAGLSNVEMFKGFSILLSWFIPVSELIVAVLLILPNTRKWGLYVFIGLMVLFTGYISGSLLWAKNLPCSCGGVIEKMSWKQHVWFNLAFIAIAVFALRLNKLKKKI